MADISKITLPTGTTYNLKDTVARESIGALSGAVKYLGVTTTELTDGATTSPITIEEESVNPKAGDVVIYGENEFIWSDTGEGKWHEFGSTGSLKALAFVDSVSATYTPAGTVSTPDVTVELNTTSITPFESAGSLPTCTLPSLSTSVTNETLTLSWSAGSFSAGTLPSAGTAVTVATDVKTATASKPTFTGTETTITST